MAKAKNAQGYWNLPKPPKAVKSNASQSQINTYNQRVTKWEADCKKKHAENEDLRKSRESAQKTATSISGGFVARKGGKKRR